MSDSLNIRARFPDGQTLALQGLAMTTSMKTLVTRIRTYKGWTGEPRILVAGAPPREVRAPPLRPVREVMPSGTSLIVEPHPDDAPSAAGLSGRSTVRGRGRERANASAGRGRGGRGGGRIDLASGNIKTLADLPRTSGSRIKRQLVDDDANDVSWDPSLAADPAGDDDDDDNSTAPSSSKRRRNGSQTKNKSPPNRRQTSAAASSSRLSKSTSNAPLPYSPTAWTAAESVDMSAIALEVGINAAQGQLGAMLAASVFDVDGRNGNSENKISKELRANFANALKKRSAEADGERRYSAYMGKSYELTPVMNGLKFRVRYRPMESKNWIDDNNGDAFMSWPKGLIKAVIGQVLFNSDEKARLRPLEMAAVSPRMFWNLVRIFCVQGDAENMTIEEGLKSLAPEADWSFLDERQRKMSEKAKRNAQNEQDMKDMGWKTE